MLTNARAAFRIAAVALSLCTGSQTAAQNTAAVSSTAPSGYALPETETFDLTTADDGRVYRIFVSRPTDPAPPGGFPVLYVLDGNAFFPGFAGERRLEAFAKQAGGGLIVVGVGYPTDQVYDSERRQYDLTSAWPDIPLPPGAAKTPRTGGNEHFARFLLDQLRPEIARRYRVAAGRQSLFGHSLGGLFALHMLYTRPTAFDAVIAASPSQWWNDGAILTEERAFADRLAAGKIAGRASRLLLLTGERDSAVTIGWDAEALLKRLEPLSARGLRIRFELLREETHITVPYRAITPTLRFVAVTL